MKKILARVVNRAVRPLGLACVVRPEIRPAPEIPEACLGNARIVPNRVDGLYLIPKGGVVAEVGVAFGNFSRHIIRVVEPEKFFAIDTFELDEVSWTGRGSYKKTLAGQSHEEYYKKRFEAEVFDGRLVLKKGYSSSVLAGFDDCFFDLIYIDAAHDYLNVKADLEVAVRKTKQDGLIVLNDYTVIDPLLLQPYGIVQAVNELCEGGSWEFVYLALHRYMFCDVALRRLTT